MKNHYFITVIFILGITLSCNSQSKGTFNIEIFEIIKKPLSHMNKVIIFHEGLGNYIEQIEIEQKLAYPVGYIVKFIKIDEDSIIFSMSYFYSYRNIKEYAPIYHYVETPYQPILFTRSDSISLEYDSLMNDFSFTNINKDFLESIKYVNGGADIYFEGVAIYTNNKLILKIYPNNETPYQYMPQSDEFIRKLKKYIEFDKDPNARRIK